MRTSVHTYFEAHPASHPMGTGGLFNVRHGLPVRCLVTDVRVGEKWIEKTGIAVNTPTQPIHRYRRCVMVAEGYLSE
jgi:hypothetical protein